MVQIYVCELSVISFLVEVIHFPACSVVTCPEGCDTLKVVLIILDTYLAEMNRLQFQRSLCHTLHTYQGKHFISILHRWFISPYLLSKTPSGKLQMFISLTMGLLDITLWAELGKVRCNTGMMKRTVDWGQNTCGL